MNGARRLRERQRVRGSIAMRGGYRLERFLMSWTKLNVSHRNTRATCLRNTRVGFLILISFEMVRLVLALVGRNFEKCKRQTESSSFRYRAFAKGATPLLWHFRPPPRQAAFPTTFPRPCTEEALP
uniref:Uncharacterized protein n=1 Tax=Vespula pensylvanica TaxID=30213 RepID=A0A834N5Z3_VESPE|nr:hypothetical protein H0235_016063 [Vespula pensylvanica]